MTRPNQTRTLDIRYYRLAELMQAATVWTEKGAIVGRASDGVIVQLGSADNLPAVAAYLDQHPVPETW